MGTKSRPKPKRLPEKLRAVRDALGISQTDMLKRLGIEDTINYSRISEFELGKREPTLMILMEYSRIAGVHMEAFVDDALDLPNTLPGNVNYTEISRQYATRSRARKR